MKLPQDCAIGLCLVSMAGTTCAANPACCASGVSRVDARLCSPRSREIGRGACARWIATGKPASDHGEYVTVWKKQSWVAHRGLSGKRNCFGRDGLDVQSMITKKQGEEILL
jgi:hypothetical protein